MRKNINNPKKHEWKRKEVRLHSTAAEAALWLLLKNRQLDGRKFRRQFGVGPYVLDFYCHTEKLAVELDGMQYFTEEGKAKDEAREAYLVRQHIIVIRIENKKVFDNTGQVLEHIKDHFRNSA